MKYIQYEGKDQIGCVTISRPQELNALNRAVLTELDAVFSHIDTDIVRCVLLTGAGERAFVAGADIGEMQPMHRDEAYVFSTMGKEIFRKIELFPVPVIAVVNGFALGGGCELTLACDMRIAGENAIFGLPEVTLGITPGYGGTQRLARLIGLSKAKELLYTGRKIQAQEALLIGLVNAVFPAQELREGAEKIARQIAANAPIAVRATKRAVTEGYDLPLCEALAPESECFAACFESADQKEAMAAFLEKRKPNAFENR